MPHNFIHIWNLGNTNEQSKKTKTPHNSRQQAKIREIETTGGRGEIGDEP